MGIVMPHSLSLTIKPGDPFGWEFAWEHARAALSDGVRHRAACCRVRQRDHANLRETAGAAGERLPIQGLMDSTR